MTPERKKLVLILVAVAIFDLLTAAGVYLWWVKSRPEQVRFPDEKERVSLAVRMQSLSRAVDGYFARQTAPPTGSDAEILRQAVADVPSLLAADFAPYLLKVQPQQAYAVLLLCTKDGGRAILEDAGCSVRLDRQARDNAPCAFTLRVQEGCRVEGADKP
ncbi:hypothetical protein [Candidatus Electronema sp. TJ]|uniref:hypothetical protein n=1 Tax=Candidatus Electronema sp. TJ TaxID=3401573 RepID=UPI003AA86E79